MAQELVQETFLAAWKNLHQIQQPDRIRYWLMGILRNQFTKQLSQETRHRHEVLNREPVTAAEDRVLKDSLQTAIASLDDDQRLALEIAGRATKFSESPFDGFPWVLAKLESF